MIIEITQKNSKYRGKSKVGAVLNEWCGVGVRSDQEFSRADMKQIVVKTFM